MLEDFVIVQTCSFLWLLRCAYCWLVVVIQRRWLVVVIQRRWLVVVIQRRWLVVVIQRRWLVVANHMGIPQAVSTSDHHR